MRTTKSQSGAWQRQFTDAHTATFNLIFPQISGNTYRDFYEQREAFQHNIDKFRDQLTPDDLAALHERLQTIIGKIEGRIPIRREYGYILNINLIKGEVK